MILLKLLKEYKNGNYRVHLFSDGTKIRTTEANQFLPLFPESIDLKITDFCDQGCPMCHENSTFLGKNGALDHPFFDTLQSGTEIAIGGGNPLAHPNLLPFLERLKGKGIVANITVNQNHLFSHLALVEELMREDYIHGLGVSLTEPNSALIDFCQRHPQTVIHVIVGYHDLEQIQELSNKGLKVLFLGYKHWGRGKDFFSPEIQFEIDRINQNIMQLSKGFKITSFDNLSLEQLQIKQKVSPSTWESQFMGDDGQFTMYIDLVKEQFAVNSTHEQRFPLLENIETMFELIRNTRKQSDGLDNETNLAGYNTE